MTLISKALVSSCLVSLLAGCAPDDALYEIRFAAGYGDQPLRCAADEAGPRLRDLRFYVHDVMLLDDAGSAVRLEIVPDGQWQDEQVALIDLEDGTGDCQHRPTA